MIAPVILLLVSPSERPALVSVHSAVVDGRAVVEVVTTAPASSVALERSGGELVLTLDASLPRALGAITPAAPVEAVELESTAAGVAVRVHVVGEVPHELRREGAVLTLVFGAAPAPVETEGRAVAGDVQELYRRLLPAPTAESSALVDSETPPSSGDEGVYGAGIEGLRFGRLTLRPSISGLYIDAENALLETARPLRDRYYEVRPQVSAALPLSAGDLTGDYEARFHRGSSFPVVQRTTTHLANAAAEVPLGPSLVVRAGGHFARGLMETTEVDPGREYFFQLGAYTRYDVSGGVRVQTGGRLDLDLSVNRQSITVEENTGFFDYERRTGSAGIGIELGPSLRSLLAYMYEEIPFGPERPEAQMRAHSGVLSLQGEILPLVTGNVTAGYRTQRNPGAGPGGTVYDGLSASARIVKEFTPAAALTLTAARFTPPSAFQSNGFFVASSIQAEIDFPLPLSLSGHAGGGYHWNAYRVVSPEIGRPREDRISSWSAGVGRSITEWAHARGDYRHERRQSNIDLFDTRAHALTVQVGLRLYRSLDRR